MVRAPDSGARHDPQPRRDADGIITRSKLPDDVFEAAPRVRAVAIHGTGTDLVPLQARPRAAIMVSNIPGGNAQSVAEYCVHGNASARAQHLAIVSFIEKHNLGCGPRARRGHS